MKAPEIGSQHQPFPSTRPEITIRPSEAKPFALQSRLLPGWGVAVEVGAVNWMASYDPPDWALTSVMRAAVPRRAEIHGVEGVEIETVEWEATAPVWRSAHTHYARLTDELFQWLAISHVRDEKRVLYTFLDEGFDSDWGESSRKFETGSRLTLREDGTYELEPASQNGTHDVVVAGMFDVQVADREFVCLRVIEVLKRAGRSDAQSLERDILSESFYTADDELVLFRRYNGRLWSIESPGRPDRQRWDQRLPDHARLVINGAVFVHWYDCLTDVSVPLV